MELTILSNGVFGSNTYIVESRNDCAIIDCGNKPKDILKVLRERNLNARYIILTHGHIDHILYAGEIKNETDALLCIHKDDMQLYSDPVKNGYDLFGFDIDLLHFPPDYHLKDGDKLPLGDDVLEIIHTPGHSPGGISVLCDKMLFTGDTLFQLSIGRTDLSGGSLKQLSSSIKNRLYTLNDDVVVYPGHGPSTTIAFERENNPYV
ncbi:MAG: MBL fold metallo-hydrolase [Clostridiaceae bacterium]|jgi:hydroxyacylglutathione hydrolase|nr:MBL fold metallo-hydrolase [Clostridiaceae bacterium]